MGHDPAPRGTRAVPLRLRHLRVEVTSTACPRPSITAAMHSPIRARSGNRCGFAIASARLSTGGIMRPRPGGRGHPVRAAVFGSNRCAQRVTALASCAAPPALPLRAFAGYRVGGAALAPRGAHGRAPRPVTPGDSGVRRRRRTCTCPYRGRSRSAGSGLATRSSRSGDRAFRWS